MKNVISARNRRALKEYLSGYLMIAPAVILIFTFGIFPVGFALYVSLFRWRLKQGDFLGIDNYIAATGNIIYIVLFGLSAGALVGAYLVVRKAILHAREKQDRPWITILPGLLYTSTVFLFLRWAFLALPEFLGIADKIIGKEKTRALFSRLLWEAFTAKTVLPAWEQFAAAAFLSLLVGIIVFIIFRNPDNLFYQLQFFLGWLAAATGLLLIWYTYQQVAAAYVAAAAAGTDPGIWTQMVTIIAGTVLLWLAWKLWNGAQKQDSRRSMVLHLFGAVTLIVGGWLLIGEIPVLIAQGDPDLWEGLKITVFYALGTIPFQLGFSIFLAVLLFQKLYGSSLFRMLFFLPYVTPAVASAAVFRQLFSNRLQAPINVVFQAFGLEPLKWLYEPTGVFTMIADKLGIIWPAWAAGPSLALVVIIIYSIWTFVGYDTVIYLAGLGNIPTELMEAAEIDGAGRWEVFRYITLPLLSPTTYFLTLIAVIGTFKAFNHIWVMRQAMALGTTDTFSVVIFQEFYDKLRYGYASALAFVLFGVILLLTVLNNSIQGKKVFYG